MPQPLALPAWLPYALIALVTFFFFLPVLANGFVNWDDDFTLLLNPHYRGLGWTQLKWMFTTFHMGHYQPLSWVTFGLDYTLWGLNPKGFHLTALLLHCANAMLFYAAAKSLLRLSAPEQAADDWALMTASVFSALVFALHPLRVESVAWATERRDILSAFFLLICFIYYLKSVAEGETKRAKYYWLALACYPFSLISKGIGVSLPAVLIALDFYPLRRLPAAPAQWAEAKYRDIWAEKLPFAAFSVAAGILGLFAQISTGATGFMNVGELPSLPTRLLQALYGLSAYLWKTLLPFHLLPLYERVHHAAGPQWYIFLGAAATAALTVFLLLRRRRQPYLLTAWACYIALLLPVLQLVPFGPYIIADRYTYLGCLPLALLAGGFLLRVPAPRREQALAAAAVVLAALGLLTWRQVGVWKSPETLWRHILAGDPDSTIAHSNLGSILLDQQHKVLEAEWHFREAIRIRPEYAFGHYNYGNAISAQGRYSEAMDQYRQAIRLMPDHANSHYNLANMLMNFGRMAEAEPELRETIRLQPDHCDAYNNLGVLLLRRNDVAGAAESFRGAIRVCPGYRLAAETLAKMQAAGQIK